ncbi:hypothetical protein BDP27DRAFT_1420263 [Rhodocollybia butyracea]|uniref:Uncharacterized protein n=1 Tax=Rhodocollybia butyracea TaxID=206335 RepID=A0A9P5U8P3_9AGAR|nr:hypothetical protein BDP27DRAFT_1420263 [Rhodocollybia butyracea]
MRKVSTCYFAYGRSFEGDAFTKINDDITANRVNPLVLRAVYKALQPGYIYIEAQSMLSRNTPLAAYLRTIPGLVYLSSPKISFANEQAWSRKHERVKKPPPPTWSAPDSTMPIYQNITDAGFNPQTQTESGLPPGTWVVPSSGRYKGYVGLVIKDNYESVDMSVSALVMFIPRIKFPNAALSKQPPKATLPVDFRKSPMQWPDFEYHSRLEALCIEDNSGVHAAFAELPMPDKLWHDLHTRVPPPESWCFLEGDHVALTDRFGTTGSLLMRCDLANLRPGVVGTVLTVEKYACDVDLHELGHRSIPFYNLVKTIDVGRSVKISDMAGNLQEIKHIELGESALSLVSASRVMLAGRDSIVTHCYEVPSYGESLNIWVQDLELVITLDPNSILDNTDNQVYLRHFPPSVPHQVFNEFSVVEKQQPVMTSVKESAWLLQNNHRSMHIHPSQYYELGSFRPPGRLPWFGVRVNVDLGEVMASGEVQDVVPHPDNASEFQVLVVAYDDEGNRQSSWFDYCNIRRQDNHGQLHEFNTYTGRIPWQGVQVQVIHGPLKDFGVGIVKDVSVNSDPKNISGLVLDLEFESGYVYVVQPMIGIIAEHNLTAAITSCYAFQQDFWLLDRRISHALGSREIYVLVPAEGKDVRILFHLTSTGLKLQGGDNHKGGRKAVNAIDPRTLSMSPMSLKLKGGSTANGLYIIGQGEHAGKLTRRVNYIQTYPPNPENDTWVLQVVRCVWVQGKALDHKESIVTQEPLLRLRKQVLALVHETDKEKAQGNTIMATLHLQQGGAAPGFTLVNGQAAKIRR